MTTLLIATRNAHKIGEIQSILGADFHCRSLLKEFPDAPVPVEDADSFSGNAAKKAESLAAWLGDVQPEPGRAVLRAASTFHSEGQGHAQRGPTTPPMERVFVLADDSGLEVDALGGAPGIHSARFAALDSGHDGNSPDADNNAKLLRLLADVSKEKRTARFRCVLALVEVSDGRADLRSASSSQADNASRAQRGPIMPQLFDGACEGWIDFAPRGAGGFGYDPLFIPLGREQSFAELGESVKNGLSHRALALARLREWFRRSGESD